MTVALLAALALQLPAPDTVWWSAGLGGGYERVTPDRPDWGLGSAYVERRTARHTLRVQGNTVRRFERNDAEGVLDAYRVLGRGAYLNLRLSAASDADVLPRFSAAAEVFVAGGGIEWSAHARHAALADLDVTSFGAGLGRYQGNWYLRGRASVVPVDESTGASGFVAVRRVFADPREFVEFGGGGGREVVVLPGGTTVRSSEFAVARGAVFLTPRVSVGATATWASDVDVQERTGVYLEVGWHW